MIKKLLKWGNGLGIYFDTKDIELYGMKINDKIDLSDMFLTQITIKKVNNTYKKLPKSKDMKKEIKEELK